MTESVYASLLNLSAGAFLVAAVLIVWRRDLHAMISLLAGQGLVLAAIPVVEGIHTHDHVLVGAGIGVVLVRAIVMPALLRRALGARAPQQREASPLVNTTASLLIAAALTVFSYAVTRPVVALDPSAATRALPAAFAVILIAIFVMTSRRKALSQAVGFLMLANGIAATAFLVTAGVPLIVELGASVDIVLAIAILAILIERVRRAFGATEVDQMRELQD